MLLGPIMGNRLFSMVSCAESYGQGMSEWRSTNPVKYTEPWVRDTPGKRKAREATNHTAKRQRQYGSRFASMAYDGLAFEIPVRLTADEGYGRPLKDPHLENRGFVWCHPPKLLMQYFDFTVLGYSSLLHKITAFVSTFEVYLWGIYTFQEVNAESEANWSFMSWPLPLARRAPACRLYKFRWLTSILGRSLCIVVVCNCQSSLPFYSRLAAYVRAKLNAGPDESCTEREPPGLEPSLSDDMKGDASYLNDYLKEVRHPRILRQMMLLRSSCCPMLYIQYSGKHCM